MQLNELQPTVPRKSQKRIGRGGKRGKMSGRGHKGQTARAGNSTRPEMRDIIKKLPKLRGHGKNRARTVNAERPRPVVVNIAALETTFEAGATVTPASLVAAKLVTTVGKRPPLVKLLGTGTLTKRLVVESCQVSEAAKVKIEAAGGTVK
jgi:large subunit ribosomal protein L15